MIFGGHKAVVRPDPIPNSAVKHSLADGSSPIGSARVGCRQSFEKSRNFSKVSAFVLCFFFNFNFKLHNPAGVSKGRKKYSAARGQGERFVFSHRGRPAALLEPITVSLHPTRQTTHF